MLGRAVQRDDKLLVRWVDATTGGNGVAAAIIDAFSVDAWIQRPSGPIRHLVIPSQSSFGGATSVGEITSSDEVGFDDGVCVRLEVRRGAGGVVKRGQLYVEVGFGAAWPVAFLAARGYLYDGHIVTLGEDTEPGPSGGRGVRRWKTIFHDQAGTTTATITAATNTYVRLFGVIYWYNCSADAATRLPTLTLNTPGGATPTGFTTETDVWVDAMALSLTASQEGNLFLWAVPGGGHQSKNQNGTITIASTATSPMPLPYDFDELDLASFAIATGGGHANDRWSVYAFTEEWVVL